MNLIINSKKFFSFLIALILILFSFCIADKISYNIIDNKVFDSLDGSNYKLTVPANVFDITTEIHSNNLTKIQLFYTSNKDYINFITFSKDSYFEFTVKTFSFTDTIKIIELHPKNKISNNSINQINFKIYSDQPVQIFKQNNSESYMQKQFGLSKKIRYLLFIVILTLCISFFLLFYIIIRKKFKPCNIYLILAFIFCFINVFVFPPIGQPDAACHYESIYNFSNAILGLKAEEGFMQKRKCDLNLFPDFYNEDKSLKGHSYIITVKQFLNHIIKNRNLKKDLTLISVPKYKNIITPRIEYLPQALLMSLGRLLKFNQFALYFFVLFGNCALIILITYFAVKLSKDNYLLFILLGLQPYLLIYIFSITYDPIVYSISLLAISTIYNIMTSKEISINKAISFSVIALLLFPLKTIYFPISLLLLSLVLVKTTSLKPKQIICSIFILLFICILILSLKYGNSDSSTFTIKYILSHPIKAFTVSLRTLTLGTEWYNFQNTLLLGYNWTFDILLVLILLVPVSEKLSKNQTILFLFCYFLITVFLYIVTLSWTQTNSRVIWGIQQRYFFPIAMLLFIPIQQFIKIKLPLNKNLMFYLTGCFCFINLATRIAL